MRGAHIVVTCWFTLLFTITIASNGKGQQISESDESMLIQEHHTIVALIDIVFVDTSKRTCTGAIIHDYVVITAAHCLVKEGSSPELTLSFIVIGTRKMFNSGYEQYLPIERYKIHPKFKGWTANLALVYTFAAMTSDKPGKVLHLANDSMKDPTDTVTVLSWGQISDKFKYGPMKIYKNEVPVTTKISTDSTEEETTKCNKSNKKRSQTPFFQEGIRATHMRVESTTYKSYEKDSQHLTLSDKHFKSNRTKRRKDTSIPSPHKKTRRFQDPMKAYYSNWRRRMGPQQNNLTVETFSFVNFKTCQRLVELVMPPLYELKDDKDVVCYTSEEYMITTEDSGAPAIRRGRLLAVTAGAVDADGERVAVGVRVSCFCSWIADNLPSAGTTMRCCKNCCANETSAASKRQGPKKRSSKLSG